jgi:[acyl-carrier-protein] S-malonyltransferase
MVPTVLALLFPGQGSQRPQMGQPWNDHPAWPIVDRLSESTGRDIAGLLLNADADTLKATRNAQLAAYTLSLVVHQAARISGLDYVTVSAVAGHSLGEYTALVAAGALEAGGGAALVAERGEAMQTAADSNPGTMAAVLGLEEDLVVKVCEDIEDVWPANDNAPGQVVIAGTPAGIERASEAAKRLGAKRVMGLPVGGAFHSPLMAPAQSRLDSALSSIHFHDAAIDVVANVDAAAHRTGFAQLLARQLVAPVRWRESLLTLRQMGVTHYLELGPGSELSGMVKRTVEDSVRHNVATPDDLDKLQPFLESVKRG